MPGISRISRSALSDDLPRYGNWQTVSLLGQGRWARVYRARPREAPDSAPADYAVKVAEPEDPSDRTLARQMLIRETQVGRAVSHPHLTCILASHLNQPPYYLVMPYMAGESVQSVVRRSGTLPVPCALRIARQCAAAADALHRHGWLHGDIKPGNIHVADDGHVTLLDLGLARQTGSANQPERRPLAGTLAYLAPETFGSVTEAGPASDVYSLGATLYRMLAPRLPFVFDTAAEVAEAHQQLTPPDPRRFNPRLDPAVVQLVLRMLAKPPGQRPRVDALISQLVALEIATFAQRFAA